MKRMELSPAAFILLLGGRITLIGGMAV